MPPKTPSASVALSALARPFGPAASSVPRCLAAAAPAACAGFSTTPSRHGLTLARRRMIEWEKRHGKKYRLHKPGRTNYIEESGDNWNSTRPFPVNTHFKSKPVLDDEARELIWKNIIQKGDSIKSVSAEFGVDIRRVAAVVRLKEVEKEWESKGKKLAIPYANAILEMLPTHKLDRNTRNKPLEPINELHVHPYTMQQLFWPTSESRHFTREDAAKAFHPRMLSADARVPHPELIQMEREIKDGTPPYQAVLRFKTAVMESERAAAEAAARKVAQRDAKITRVKSPRFEFRFEKINSELVGPKGKARNAVGWRYGAPSYDRAKGQVKIPTSVP